MSSSSIQEWAFYTTNFIWDSIMGFATNGGILFYIVITLVIGLIGLLVWGINKIFKGPRR